VWAVEKERGVMKRYVWVVEMEYAAGDGWRSTVGIGLTRDVARREATDWRERNPGVYNFRLRKYTPEEE